MRRNFIAPFVAEKVSHDLRVDVEPFVRVDADAEETRVGVDLQHQVARAQVVQDASPGRVRCMVNDSYL